MATVINNPDSGARSDGGMGTLFAVVMLLLAAIVFFIYGLPYIRGATVGPQINIPSNIDVNLRNK